MSVGRRKLSERIAAMAAALVWGVGVVPGGAAPAGADDPAAAPPAAGDPAAVAASDRAAAVLAPALAAGDTTAYAQALDRLLYDDLVADLDAPDRPPRPPFDPDLLRRSLDTVSALVAFLPDGDVTWALAVTRDGLLARRLDTPHTPVMAARLRRWADDPAAGVDDVRAALLVHNNLFPPFEALLGTKRHVIVAAGGPLRDLPFEVLLMASGEGLPPVERPYLLHRFEMAYEATLGSRLGWSSRPGELQRLRAPADSGAWPDEPIVTGTLVAVAGRPPGGWTAASLHWMRAGGRAALLGGTETGMDAFLRRYFRESAGGRRPAVRDVYRVRSALLREGAPARDWAWPMLFGAE